MESDKKFVTYKDYTATLIKCGATKNECRAIIGILINAAESGKEDIPGAEVALKMYRGNARARGENAMRGKGEIGLSL